MISMLYEPFRRWTENGSVLILSDLHLADPDCKKMDPNWISPDAQIDIVNKSIRGGDTFVCLGDVGDPEIARKIKAKRKVLLLGNHDKACDYRDIFDEIYDGPLMIAEKIMLSHEPVQGLKWCVNIHGHDHSGCESGWSGCKHLNLAANVCGYRPVNLGALIKNGLVSDIQSIHRITIDGATERKKKRIGKRR